MQPRTNETGIQAAKPSAIRRSGPGPARAHDHESAQTKISAPWESVAK